MTSKPTFADAVTFRQLGNVDLQAVASVQLKSWRGTYAGVLPDEYLGAPMASGIERRWSSGLTPLDALWGAIDDAGTLLGFAAVRLGNAPYLDNLHVLEEARGSGMSYRLMAHVADAIIQIGARDLWLTVVDSNLRARAFYNRLGGREGEAKADEMLGNAVVSLPVYWSDLTELSKNARQVVSPLDGGEAGT